MVALYGSFSMSSGFRKSVVCRVCGCVDEDCYCCVAFTGDPCYWVEADLCSACADPAGPCPGGEGE